MTDARTFIIVGASLAGAKASARVTVPRAAQPRRGCAGAHRSRCAPRSSTRTDASLPRWGRADMLSPDTDAACGHQGEQR